MVINAKKYLWLQILCILVVISQPFWLSFRPANYEPWWLAPTIIRDLIANFAIVLFFYLNIYYIIPRYFITKRYVLYFIMLTICFCIILFMPSWIVDIFSAFSSDKALIEQQKLDEILAGYNLEHAIKHQILLFIAIITASLLLYQVARLNKVEKARRDVEMSYLLTQINPHFLFNALNSVYALSVKEQATQTSNSLLLLSGMMRYVVYAMGKNFVPLSQEIAYLGNFIEMQKLRLPKDIKVWYSFPKDIGDQKIAPLILIPFVENAFKHGVNPDEPSDLTIDVQLIEDTLVLNVTNQQINKVELEDRSGVGVVNAKERLALLYPGRYALTLHNDAQFFHVLLKLELND